MPNINELDLTPESVPEIIWDAPESGSFPPQVKPGTHEFAFALGDDPWDMLEIQKQKCLQVVYSATTDTQEHGEVTLNFQRATTFQSAAMRQNGTNHMIGELIRSLAIRIEGPVNKDSISEVLTSASAERRHFRADVGWRRYCKSCDTTVSTNPRKKKGDVPWPRTEDKQFEMAVSCPSCGDRGYGNAEIIRFKLPDAGTQVMVYSTTEAQGVSPF